MIFREDAARSYSVVILRGLGATTGGRKNVAIRFTSNGVTAISSITAETGKNIPTPTLDAGPLRIVRAKNGF